MNLPRHSWDDENIVRIAAVEADNGCSQTIRTCAKCGLMKFTMHPPEGFPWLEFLLPHSKISRVKLDKTPACFPRPVDAEPPKEVPAL